MTSYIDALITKVHKSSEKAKNGLFEHNVNLNNIDGTQLSGNCKLFSKHRKVFVGVKVTIKEIDNKKYISDIKCSSNENYTFKFLMHICSDWLNDNKHYSYTRNIFEVNDFSKKIDVLVKSFKLIEIIRRIIIIYDDFHLYDSLCVDFNNKHIDIFDKNYKKSYKDISNDEIIELIRYIVNEYHVNDYYDLKENYTRKDLLNSMIQKPKFEPSLFIYNIFKNNLGIDKVDDISRLPKFIIKLIKDSKYRKQCKHLFNTLKLFNKIYHYNDKNSSKYDEDEEDTSDIESYGNETNDYSYFEKLEEYLYEKDDNGKLVINEYKKDNLTEDNELIIAFRDEFIKYLPKIIKNSRIYHLTKDIELINQIINNLDNSDKFNAQCIILNITYYLTGYKEYYGNLALSTIPKYHLGRLSNRWKKYFQKHIGKSEIYNYISKVELIKVIKGVLKNFSKTFDKCKNKNEWSVEDSSYQLSYDKLLYLHNISEKKITNILDKLVKLNRLSLFNNKIYVTDVFNALKTCSKFIYNRINDDLIDFQESQHYNEEFDYKTNQQLAAEHISLSSTSAVIGFPGTGKTDVLVSEIFNHDEDCDVWVITPTGKATSNIIDKCSRLKPNTRDSKLIISTIDSRRFNLILKPNNVTNITLYVDEAGMIGCHKFYEFIQIINYTGIIIDKLVFFGDTNQLPPVNDICKTSILKEYQKLVTSDIFNDLRDTYDNVPNITELDEIVRSNNEEMCEMFMDLSRGKTLKLKNMITNNNSNVKCVTRKYFENSLMNNIEFNSKSEHLVLTLENKTVNEYNSKFQKNYHNLKYLCECFKGSSEYEFKKNKYLYGDIVMNLKNKKVEYEVDHKGHPVTELLPNGEIGIVDDSYENSEHEKIVKVKYDCLKESKVYEHKEQLRHAFTITVHKSQGAEAKNIYFIFDSDWGASRELIYTALTRAEETITIVTDNISKIYDVIKNKPIREIKSGFQEIFESMFDIELESSSEFSDG